MLAELFFWDSTQIKEVATKPDLFDVSLMPVLGFYLLNRKLFA